jgi:hypothetical protein
VAGATGALAFPGWSLGTRGTRGVFVIHGYALSLLSEKIIYFKLYFFSYFSQKHHVFFA